MLDRIYVSADRVGDRADVEGALRSHFPGHAVRGRDGERSATERAWWCIELELDPTPEIVEAAADRLSQALVGCTTVALRAVDGQALGLALFRDGERVRRLDYDAGDGWVLVRGAVQPWESAAFFDGDDFAEADDDALRYEFGEGSAEHRAYASRALVEGAMRPSPPRIDVAVAAALDLPSREPPDFRIGARAPTVRDASRVTGVAFAVLVALVFLSVLVGLLLGALE